MPSEAVTFVVTTGIGVSVIAGIISGVCYVFVHGLKSKQSDHKSCFQWHCTVCGSYLRSIEGVLEGEKVVTCSKCFSRVCKSSRCSEPSATGDDQEQWTCQTCLAQQNSWLQGLLNISRNYCRGLIVDDHHRHRPSKKLKVAVCSNKKMDGGGENLSKNKNNTNEEVEVVEASGEKEKEQVRRYIERIVSDILGESVDEARISRIYNDQQYDSLFDSYHREVSKALNELGSSLDDDSLVNLPVIGQSAATVQATLKQIIERLLVEAAHLPSLKRSEDDLATSSSDERNQTYEDLLATAILNKVVSSYQNKTPSPAPSTSSRFSSSSRNKGESGEFFFGDSLLDKKSNRNTDLDTTSVSSLEEWLHQPSDSSLGSTKYIDKVSLTIQHRIEEGTPSESEDENLDDSEYFRTSSSLLLNDDSNWYLQRRQFQGTHSPVPVPMLVPNPTVEAKVLIGDKEVEDTSDLSDAPSEDFGAQETVPSSVKALLVTSKMVIGGKNSISAGDYERSTSDTESSGDSGVKDDRDGYDEEDKSISPDEAAADASLNSLQSNTEQDTEYTERYASLPRTILKTPPSTISRSNKIKDVEEEQIEKTEAPEADAEDPKLQATADGEEREDVPFEGVYSKKEKEKWNHPVEMKNNPYSKDSIEKRLRSSDKFGRDYYTRQASNPSGTKNGTTEKKLWFVPKPYEDQDEDPTQDIFRAVPMRIEDEIVDKTVDDSNVSMTSDSDLSFVNYYDVENSKIYQQNTNGNHTEIRISTNTEGLLYQPIDPELVPPKEKPPEIPIVDGELKDQESLHFVQTLEISSELPKENLPELCPTVKISVNTPDLYDRDSENPEIILEAINDQVAEQKSSPEIPQVKPRTFQPPVAQKRNRVPTPLQPTAVPIFNRNISTSSDIPDTPPPHPAIIHKKSDNTLIKKIYADPTVRSFAMISRGEHIPVPEPKAKKPEIISVQHKEEPSKKTRTDENSNNIDKFEITLEDSMQEASITDAEWQSDGFSLEFSDSGDTQSTIDSPLPPPSSVAVQEDREIVELKAKRLVANRLGEFSKSSPNLARPPTGPTPKERKFKEELPFERTMSVRDLMRKFETKENFHRKDKPVHSLTARSISKPIREKLKNQDSNDEITESTT